MKSYLFMSKSGYIKDDKIKLNPGQILATIKFVKSPITNENLCQNYISYK